MKILSVTTVFIAVLLHSACCQDISIVKGKFSDFEFSKISIQSHEDPFTGARDEFQAIIMDSGTFRIPAEFYAPKIFLLLVDDKPVVQFFLCPGEDLTITADSSGLRYNGSTSDYNSWSRVLRDDYLAKYTLQFAESKAKDQMNIDSLVAYLFELKVQNVSEIDKLVDEFDLSECEYLFCKNEIQYALYTFMV